MDPLWTIAAKVPALALPEGPVMLLLAGCAALAAISAVLMLKRSLATRRHEARKAADLFMVRELGSYVLGDGPIDADHLRATLEQAPMAAILQFLRLHRGHVQAQVIAQAELAGVFDPALRDLSCGVASREIAALKQLQFARAARFRSAVLRQVMRGQSALVRTEALYTLVAMGTDPSDVALAAWIDGTGPDLTPRHRALFQLIADRLPGILPDIAKLVTTRSLKDELAVLAAQYAATHHHALPSIGMPAARLRAPIHHTRKAG